MMPFKVILSRETKSNLRKIKHTSSLLLAENVLNLEQLASIIEEIQNSTLENEIAITALLEDLAKSLSSQSIIYASSDGCKKSKSGLALLLGALGLAGLINFSIWGFDGVFSVLQLITSNPYFLYIPGLFFSLIAAINFISFDFFQGAKELGVDYFDVSSVLDEYIKQDKLILAILRKIDFELLGNEKLNKAELNTLLSILEKRSRFLDNKKAQLNDTKESKRVEWMEKGFSFLCGLLFFFDGYFCGQAGAMFILGVSSVSAGMATPIGAIIMVGLGIVSSIGAGSFYWLVQQKSVEYLVSALFGKNKEKLEVFCKPERQERKQNEMKFRYQFVNKFCEAQKPKGEKIVLDDANGKKQVSLSEYKKMKFFHDKPLSANSQICVNQLALKR